MKRTTLLCLVLLLAPCLSFPQAKNVEPMEPEIILPQVVLEISDLSVEKVEAKLPPEEDLLPPERKIPLPAIGEIPVGEPSIPLTGPVSDILAGSTANPTLATEALLGAGLENTIQGALSVKTLGKDPRFSLSFSHLTIDGYTGHQAGSGYNTRNDDLSGELAMKLGPVEGKA